MLKVRPASSKLLLFHLYASCCFLLSYHVVAVAVSSPFSFSFDFSNESSYSLDDLLFQGHATPPERGLVDLTCNSITQPIDNCTGRMSYNHPVPFYDNTTGVVASFSTQFSFAIRIINRYFGDGMAFFLSDYPSMLPKYSGGGDSLGLHNGDGVNGTGTKRIVAVEFDTFQNYFDPSTNHIGIDINTTRHSVNTTILPNLSLNGSMTASITFNSTTRMLLASLQFDDDPSRRSYQVSAQLTNPVTDLLPSEVAVGFSAATGETVELHQIMSWSFNSTLARKGVTSRGLSAQLWIGGAILLLVILVVVIWISVACCKHIHRVDSFLKGAGDLAKRFEYRDLAVATDKFSDSRELGQGAFGIVYEGKLKDRDGQHHQVAVKKIKGSNGDFDDFHAELKTISETRHKNLVRLKGWCSRNRRSLIGFICWWRLKQNIELFLVYELVPNGNLDVHLNGKEQVLPWAMRYNIAKDIGSALRYLHHECSQCILHRDIKPGNILLDEQFNAKLADFGLSRIAHNKNEAVLTITTEMLRGDFNANAVVLTKANGTVAYMDPRCMKDGIVSFDRSSDVYSFGIVLLEIACTGKSRVEVWDLYKRNQENTAAAADARLNGVFDVAQMHHVAVLGLWCSFPDDARRPSLLQAMDVLENDAPLPNLIQYDSGVAGSEGSESIDKGVDGTRHSQASLANGGLLAQPRTPSTFRRHRKSWQRSGVILSYVNLAHVSETDQALSG